MLKLQLHKRYQYILKINFEVVSEIKVSFNTKVV
jgi:hypothetical protein